MPAPLSLFSVNAVLIMSTDDSSRIFAKYYSPPHLPAGATANSTDYPGANPYPNVKDQKSFEKGLMEKTSKQTSDIILYDNRIVVFKTEGDVMIYVVGGAEENEVLLYNVVVSLRDALNILLRYDATLFYSQLACSGQLAVLSRLQALTCIFLSPSRASTDKRTIVENYDLVTLAIDEIVDDGIILETDPVLIASRVSKPPAQDAPNMKNIDLSEQGLLNAWEFGKRRLAEQLRQGL